MKRNRISESASISSSEGHKNKTNCKHKSDTYKGGGDRKQRNTNLNTSDNRNAAFEHTVALTNGSLGEKNSYLTNK